MATPKMNGGIPAIEQDDNVQPGGTVKAATSTDTPAVPGDYHEYEGSESKMYATYENRQAALSDALGNKDSVKG